MHKGGFARHVAFFKYGSRNHAENSNFTQNLIVSDEIYFKLNECINIRFFGGGADNPKDIIDILLYNTIFGSYSSEIGNGQLITEYY